ncbi:Yps3p [Sugiyamaella lignohabitans]|uniref:Yps3p n=1 Tax=Sugiyamaella lignohabitans TaxID=796027 RepID=A0A167CK40_9ASCO|nr:Yps3p [Sugiyamaella lignohabitans]ANB11799.1 Yps3p [Sugiyamaella lignohabitans]
MIGNNALLFVSALACTGAFALSDNTTSQVPKKTGSGYVLTDIVGKRADAHPNPRIYQYPQFLPDVVDTLLGDNILGNILLKERSDPAPVPVSNKFSYYEIDIEVGTPGQQLSLILDTGSSDLWGVSTSDIRCSNNGQGSLDCSQNTFNQEKSSTWQVNSSAPNFGIQYVDGSGAKGVWGNDVVSFGDVSLDSCSFGLATDSNSSTGIMGIAFPGQESTPYPYPNVPQLLKDQGYIETVAYSLWLNDVQASTGNILFGAVDHGKYDGPLYTIPIINTGSGSEPWDMAVTFSNITVCLGGVFSTIEFTEGTVILDSGTTFSYLPSNMVQPILKGLNAQYNSDISGYTVPCDVDDGGFIEFNLDGAIVVVLIQEFLLHLKTASGDIAYQNGKPLCQVGLVEQDDANSIHILGDTFLRSAYVVYDLQNYEISMANSALNSSFSDIEVIGSGGVRAL